MNVSDELLKYIIENDMIDIEQLQIQEQMNARNVYLNNHPYKIWEGKNGKWYTYILNEDGERRQKERNSKEEIEDCLILHYKELEENPSIQTAFYDCYNQKLSNGEISKASFDRYVCDFKRFFGEIKNYKVKEFTEYDIDDFVRKTVFGLSLTNKAYGNLRLLLFGIFKYAKRKKFVKFSITNAINDIDLSKKAFKIPNSEYAEQIFMPEEENLMIKYLTEHLDIINLGLLLMFKTGVRVGELATIKTAEIDNYTFPILRTETRYKDEDGKCIYGIKESPKTPAGQRRIVIPTKYEWVIDEIFKLNPDSIFLFEKDGHRIKSYSFRRRLWYICESKLKINPKSPHKIRKTYCSVLLDNKVDTSLVTTLVGHTEIKTTERYYHFDRKSVDEKRNALDKVLSL